MLVVIFLYLVYKNINSVINNRSTYVFLVRENLLFFK